MSWNSFLKNLLGITDTSTTSEDSPHTSGARNENLSGQAFKKQFLENPGSVLLDVRTAGEFGSGTLPGSINIDYMSGSFENKINLLDKDVTYFVFCRSGNRSSKACRIMHQKGFDVRNLNGGIGAYP